MYNKCKVVSHRNIVIFDKVPKEECSQAPCAMKGVYQPSIPDLRELYAVGVYFYVARAIGLMGKAPEKDISPQQFLDQANIYCAKVLLHLFNDKLSSNEYGSIIFKETCQNFCKAKGGAKLLTCWQTAEVFFKCSKGDPSHNKR